MFSKILNHHHAILVEGEPLASLDVIKGGLSEYGVETEGNPDVLFLSYQKFGIDEARNVIEMSVGAPVRDQNKIIVFSFESITNEAQNAFLKIFEDPSPSLKFIISTYTSEGLLPTLRSRLLVYKNNCEIQTVDVSDFMKMNIGGKLKEVERMVKDYKDSGSKQDIKKFLLAVHRSLEERINQVVSPSSVQSTEVLADDIGAGLLHKETAPPSLSHAFHPRGRATRYSRLAIKKGEKGNNKQNLVGLKATAKALDYLEDKSASVKILLESVTLAL